MLHHQNGIPLITQAVQRCNQALRFLRVQANGGFIQNIKHAGKASANLPGQAGTLQLTTGQRVRGTRKGQIPQSQLQQAIKTLTETPHCRLQSIPECSGDFQLFQQLTVLLHRQIAELPQAQFRPTKIQRNSQRRRIQAHPFTGRANSQFPLGRFHCTKAITLRTGTVRREVGEQAGRQIRQGEARLSIAITRVVAQQLRLRPAGLHQGAHFIRPQAQR